jgi:hypothetical protein
MKSVFVELPSFARYRSNYPDETAFNSLQQALMNNPKAGRVMQNTGGLRKLRWSDAGRHKGKRGGVRVIYYWWEIGQQFWLFTLYSKGEVAVLSVRHKIVFRLLLKSELEKRRKQ